MASDLAFTTSGHVRNHNCFLWLCSSHHTGKVFNYYSYDIIQQRGRFKTLVFKFGSNHVILLAYGCFFHIWYLHKAMERHFVALYQLWLMFARRPAVVSVKTG